MRVRRGFSDRAATRRLTRRGRCGELRSPVRLSAWPSVSLPLTVLGVALVCIGAAFLWRHQAGRRGWTADAGRDPEATAFLERQHRRRVRTSALIVLIGLLIPAGDAYFTRHPDRRAEGVFWGVILLLTAALVLFAALDAAATAAHTRVAAARLRRRREELEQDVRRLRDDLRRDR